MGHNSPIIKIFEKGVYVEVKTQETDFTVEKFNVYRKLKGVGKGFVYELRGFQMFCKELFVNTEYCEDIKDLLIKNDLKSKKSKKASNAQDMNRYSAPIYPYRSLYRTRKQHESTQSKQRKSTDSSVKLDDKIYKFQEEMTQSILQKYINPYAELVSYMLLYYLGFMPPLSAFKSIIENKIYLMVDQVPNFDKELEREYILGEDFKISSRLFHGRKLNKICSCFHTFRIYNYLFHLGDFHDGNYSICVRDDQVRILVFDLWMCPCQMKARNVINFLWKPNYDKNKKCNSSKAYYLLYHDKAELKDGSFAFNISNMKASLEGKERLPFITIKSLKLIFSSALKNLDKIFDSEDSKEIFYSEIATFAACCEDKTKMMLISNYLIEKIYDASRGMLLSNPYLVDDLLEYISFEDYQKYYHTDDEDRFYFENQGKNKIDSHGYLVNSSTNNLSILYENLLEIPNVDMIFIKKPSAYHIYGSDQLIKEHKIYTKSFVQNALSLFIRKPCDIDWIHVFLSIDQDINSFFDESHFAQVERNMIQDFQSENERCFFIVFNDIVTCDLYRIHLSKLHFTEISITNRYHNSLLFSYKAP